MSSLGDRLGWAGSSHVFGQQHSLSTTYLTELDDQQQDLVHEKVLEEEVLGLVLCSRKNKNLQWPWEREDSVGSGHRQRSWEGDICPGFPGEASSFSARSHIRDSWDALAEQVTHQPGPCREFTHHSTKDPRALIYAMR